MSSSTVSKTLASTTVSTTLVSTTSCVTNANATATVTTNTTASFARTTTVTASTASSSSAVSTATAAPFTPAGPLISYAGINCFGGCQICLVDGSNQVLQTCNQVSQQVYTVYGCALFPVNQPNLFACIVSGSKNVTQLCNQGDSGAIAVYVPVKVPTAPITPPSIPSTTLDVISQFVAIVSTAPVCGQQSIWAQFPNTTPATLTINHLTNWCSNFKTGISSLLNSVNDLCGPVKNPANNEKDISAILNLLPIIPQQCSILTGTTITYTFSIGSYPAVNPATTTTTNVKVIPTTVVIQPAPVVIQPAPVVIQPAPVVVQPATVVIQPAPVVIQPAPVVVQPTTVAIAQTTSVNTPVKTTTSVFNIKVGGAGKTASVLFALVACAFMV